MKASFDSNRIVDGFGFSHGGEVAAWFGRWKLYVVAASSRRLLVGSRFTKNRNVYICGADRIDPQPLIDGYTVKLKAQKPLST